MATNKNKANNKSKAFSDNGDFMVKATYDPDGSFLTKFLSFISNFSSYALKTVDNIFLGNNTFNNTDSIRFSDEETLSDKLAAITNPILASVNTWEEPNTFNKEVVLETTSSIKNKSSNLKVAFNNTTTDYYIEELKRAGSLIQGGVVTVGTNSTKGGLLIVEINGYTGLFMLSNDASPVIIADPESKFGVIPASEYCNVFHTGTEYVIQNNSGATGIVKQRFTTLSEL